MTKTHYRVRGVDARRMGQTEFEYTHQTACGYVRDAVTNKAEEVDCALCKKHITDGDESMSVERFYDGY